MAHAFGTVGLGTFGGGSGTLLFGKTWSTFFDLDASPETVDFTGGIGSSNFDTARMPQLRYTMPFTKQASLSQAVEQDQTNSTGAPFPGGAVGAFTYSGDWGHVGARVLVQPYSTFVGQTLFNPGVKYSDMALGWQLSGHFKFGSGSLQWAVLTGKGLGAYGDGIQAIGLNDVLGQKYDFWRSTGVTVGCAHVWNDHVRSNLVLSELKYKKDTLFTTGSDIEKIQKCFHQHIFRHQKER
jgi:hypothetical protein